MAVVSNSGSVIPNALKPVGSSVPSALGKLPNISTANVIGDVADTSPIAEQIQSLTKSTASQAARIATAAGPQILEQYNQDSEKKKKGLISTALDILDTPRNTLFVAVKEFAHTGEFFSGAWKGLTRQEVYSGYDLAEDMGFSGVGKAVVGFAAEVFLDPTNYFHLGLDKVAKGFLQGGVESARDEIVNGMFKAGVREAASDAAAEGLEEVGEAFATSGLKVGATLEREAVEEAAEGAAKASARAGEKQMLNRFFSKASDEAETVAKKFGWTFGSAKQEALVKISAMKASNVGKLGNSLDDITLNLAATGNYGAELSKLAQDLMNNKAALEMADEASRETLQAAIRSQTDDLLKGLRPHKAQLRLDIFEAKGMNADSIGKATDNLYRQIMSGGYNVLLDKYGVDNIMDLKTAIADAVHKVPDDVVDFDVMLEIVKEGFGDRIVSGIPEYVLKSGSTIALREEVVSGLMDLTAADDIFETAVKTHASEVGRMMGKGFGLDIPFSKYENEIYSAKDLYEAGAKARTAISYRLGADGTVTKTLTGQALDAVQNTITRVFSSMPVLSAAISKRDAKLNAWAMKLISDTNRYAKVGAKQAAEHNVARWFTYMKEAGFTYEAEVQDLGEFASRVIESKTIAKDASLDDIARIINDFTIRDATTIATLAEEQAASTIDDAISTYEGLQEFLSQYKNISFIEEATVDEAGNFIAPVIDTETTAYKNVLETIKSQVADKMEMESTIKELFSKYNYKQQSCMVKVMKELADDVDKLGKDLASFGLLDDARVYTPEYWYFPHKLSLDLMLDNEMDANKAMTAIAGGDLSKVDNFRQVLGGKTSNFSIRDVSTWKRKYPDTVALVNKRLEAKYGIKNMLETNALNTYLMYAVDQGRVLADAQEVQDILEVFGTKVNNEAMANVLRGQGQTIVARKSSLNAILLNRETVEALSTDGSLRNKLKAYNEQVSKLKKTAAKGMEAQATAKDLLEAAIADKETRRALTKETRQTVNTIKGMLKKASTYLEATDIDDETFTTFVEGVMNDTFLKGANFYGLDTKGNEAFPELNLGNIFTDDQGVPQLMVGNIDNYKAGFTPVDSLPKNLAEGMSGAYITGTKPLYRQVEAGALLDAAKHEEGLLSLISADEYAEAIANEFDSIIFMDTTGMTSIVPLTDMQVYASDLVKMQKRTGKRFAATISNTTDGGLFRPANPYFRGASEGVSISKLSRKQKSELKTLLADDWNTLKDSIEKTKNQFEETLAKEQRFGYRTSMANQAYDKLLNKGTDVWSTRDVASVSKSSHAIVNAKNKSEALNARFRELFDERVALNKQITLAEDSNRYKFLNRLFNGKSVKGDVSLTSDELLAMLGNKQSVGLSILGYDSIATDTYTKSGEMIYEVFDKASNKYMSKEALSEGFDETLKAINADTQLRGIFSILTDTGAGKDPLARIIEEVSGAGYVQAERETIEKAQGFVKKSIANNLQDIQAIKTIKPPTEVEEGLLYQLLGRGSGSLAAITEGDKISELFRVYDSVLGVGQSTGDIWAIPTEIYNYFNKTSAKQMDTSIKTMKGLMLKFNHMWVPTVTSLNPKFSLGNVMSGYFNSFMDLGTKIFDPQTTSAALKVATGTDLDEEVVLGGVKYTIGELRENMSKYGAVNSFTSVDLTTLGEELQNQLKRLDPSYTSGVKHPVRFMKNVAEQAEQYNRALAFAASLNSGHSVEMAAEIVRHTQFDYADLTEFERGVKSVMPFYTWIRKNLPFQIEKFLDDPRMYNMLMRRLPEFAKEYSGMDDEEWDNMPDWLKETFPLALGKDEATGRYRMLDPNLPYQDLTSLSNVGDTVVGLLHPLIKTPLELYLNKNLYTGSALQGFEGETAEKAIQGGANPILNAIGKVSPELLRSNPELTNAVNQYLNQFGTVRDVKYAAQGTTAQESSTAYGSREVAHSNIALLNYIENALLDTNQIRYYSAEAGLKDKLYQKSRDYSNLIQLLDAQGYEVPNASEVKTLAKQIASLDSKGKAMVNATNIAASNNMKLAVKNTLIANGYNGIIGGVEGAQPGQVSRTATRGSDKTISFGEGTYTDSQGNTVVVEEIYKGSWGKQTMKSDDGTTYREFNTTSGDTYYLNPNESNLVAWHNSNTYSEELAKYKEAYTKYMAMSSNEKPATWYSLYKYDSGYEMPVYNKMVEYNFDPEKLARWFNSNPKNIQWKQTTQNY